MFANVVIPLIKGFEFSLLFPLILFSRTPYSEVMIIVYSEMWIFPKLVANYRKTEVMIFNYVT